jgi:hypothetical protein
MKKKTLSKLVLIVIFLSITFIYWFFSNYAVISQEYYYFIDTNFLNNYSDNSFYVWNPAINNGVYTFLGPFNGLLLLKPLSILGYLLNYQNIVQFFIFSSLFISIPSYYFSFNRYFKNNALCLFSSIFYILNPWVLERVISGHVFFLISLPFYPLIISLFLKFFEKEKLEFLIYTYFFSFFVIILSIQFYLIILIIIILIFIYNILTNKKYRRKDFVFKILFFFLLIMIPFAINYVYIIGLTQQTNILTSFHQDAKTIGTAQTLLNIFTLTNGQFFYAGKIYGNLRVFYLIPLFGLFFLMLKGSKNLTYVSFAVLLIFSINYYSIYINIILFRDLTKFILIYVLLLPYISYKLFENLPSKKIKYLILVLFLTLGSYPYVFNNGYLNYVKLANIDSHAYEELNNLENTEKILFLPFWPDVKYVYISNNTLTTTDFLQYNSPYKNIYYTYNDFNSINQELLKIYSLNDINKFADKYNVRYLLFRKDILLSVFGNQEMLFITLHKELNQRTKLIFSNKYFDVFELNSKKPSIIGENISYKKINPTKYKLFIKNIKTSKDLSFMDSFHNEWRLYIKPIQTNNWCQQLRYYSNANVIECQPQQNFFDGEELSYLWEKPIFDSTHKLVNEYANGWTIDPEYIKANYPKEYYKIYPDGSIDIEMTLYFRPQSYLYLGIIISTFTFVGCIAYLTRGWWRKRNG